MLTDHAGEFGIVYRALLKRGGYSETVAVKTLKGMAIHNSVCPCMKGTIKGT